MIGIYKITNTYNHKVYIGQSKDISQRFEQHYTELERNKHCNKRMQRDYNRYKQYFIHEVIEECELRELNQKEIHWINYYDSTDPKKGYNIASGGGYKRKLPRRSVLDELTR